MRLLLIAVLFFVHSMCFGVVAPATFRVEGPLVVVSRQYKIAWDDCRSKSQPDNKQVRATGPVVDPNAFRYPYSLSCDVSYSAEPGIELVESLGKLDQNTQIETESLARDIGGQKVGCVARVNADATGYSILVFLGGRYDAPSFNRDTIKKVEPELEKFLLDCYDDFAAKHKDVTIKFRFPALKKIP
jgi:hypothetical protein